MRLLTIALASVLIPGIAAAQDISPEVFKRAAQKGLVLLEETQPDVYSEGWVQLLSQPEARCGGSVICARSAASRRVRRSRR